MSSRIGRGLALLLALGPAGAGAADYWAYQYQNIDVTVAGSSGYARDVARNADRLGVALTQVLNFTADSRLPTHIYVLPDEEIAQILGSSGSSNYNTSGYDATVIASRGRSGDDPFWGVYFGYVGAVLGGDGALRYPYWFRLGAPELFASSELHRDYIRTGGIAAGYALTVASGNLIPLRSFLALQEQDPQLQAAGVSEMYAAESWYLTREVLVEGRHRDEFRKYLGLMHEGRSERAAFTTSFNVSYEDLDRMLSGDQRVAAHVLVLPSRADDSPDPAAPRKLSAREVAVRLALVNLSVGRRTEALRLAQDALHDDPGNEPALRVLAQTQLQEGNYPAAFAAVDQLSRGALSADGMAESAAILTVLASAVTGGHTALAVDAATMLRFAQQYYQGAIAANPEDLRSWAGLAGLYGSQRDAGAARALLPAAAQALERHPHNVNLAYALAHMCAQTQQWDCAAKFAGAWRANALNEANRAEAAAFEARLGAYRQRLAAAPAGDSAVQPPRD
jgi:tetratricopeptide (TPR) repeat protein